MAEDLAVLFACVVKTKSIMIVHDAYYHYIMRDESAVNSQDNEFLKNINLAYNFMSSVLPKNKTY